MPYFITVNSSNDITDLYRGDAGYAAPPVDAIPVTDAQGEILRRGFHRYQYINGEVVLNQSLLLTEAKAAKQAEVEAARDAAAQANATALGKQWQADKRSQDLLNAAINLAQAGLPLPAFWRAADNTNMPVASIADLLAIAGAIAAQTQDAYAKSWLLKGEVSAATTVAQVEALTW